jgi:hypothetical protein
MNNYDQQLEEAELDLSIDIYYGQPPELTEDDPCFTH